MTQKGDLFKGQKKKEQAANRHGKAPHVRKGKMFKDPKKKTTELEMNKEIEKFIVQANEAKTAALAAAEGAQLSLFKAPEVSSVVASKKSKSRGAPSKSQKSQKK